MPLRGRHPEKSQSPLDKTRSVGENLCTDRNVNSDHGAPAVARIAGHPDWRVPRGE